MISPITPHSRPARDGDVGVFRRHSGGDRGRLRVAVQRVAEPVHGERRLA